MASPDVQTICSLNILASEITCSFSHEAQSNSTMLEALTDFKNCQGKKVL